MLLTLPFMSLVFIQGCSKEEPVKIGFIAGLSGRIAGLGISGRNGAFLMEKMRELQPDLPVILCTGFSEIINREKALPLP